MKIYSENPPGILTNQFDFTSDVNDKDIVLALQYDTSMYENKKTILEVLDIPIIGRQRFDKIQQYLLLKRFGINTPKTYFNTKEYVTFKSINEFDSFCDEKEFIVKPTFGARGIGIKLLNRKDYKNLIENPNEVDEIYRSELEAQKEHSPNIEQGYTRDRFRDGDMLVQEFVDVKQEFRMLCFPNDVLMYERLKQEGQLLGNISHGSIPVDASYKTFKNMKPLTEEIRTLMKAFNYPWLSVDIYADQNGDIGIFEFQMEFAYEGFDHTLVRECMETAIKSFIPIKIK